MLNIKFESAEPGTIRHQYKLVMELNLSKFNFLYKLELIIGIYIWFRY